MNARQLEQRIQAILGQICTEPRRQGVPGVQIARWVDLLARPSQEQRAALDALGATMAVSWFAAHGTPENAFPGAIGRLEYEP